MIYAPRQITIEGPLATRHGEALYHAICRVSRYDSRGYENVRLAFRVVPASRLANFLQRRMPTLQGVTLGDRVHIPSNVLISRSLLEHEAVHVWQYMVRCQGSFVRFLVGYFYLLLRRGYAAHPWEIEARAVLGFHYDRSTT